MRNKREKPLPQIRKILFPPKPLLILMPLPVFAALAYVFAAAFMLYRSKTTGNEVHSFEENRQ